jgi:hypothetical protein
MSKLTGELLMRCRKVSRKDAKRQRKTLSFVLRLCVFASLRGMHPCTNELTINLCNLWIKTLQ